MKIYIVSTCGYDHSDCCLSQDSYNISAFQTLDEAIAEFEEECRTLRSMFRGDETDDIYEFEEQNDGRCALFTREHGDRMEWQVIIVEKEI